MQAAFLIIGLVIGGVIAWLALRSQAKQTGIDPQELEALQLQLAASQKLAAELQNEKSRLDERCRNLDNQCNESKQELKERLIELHSVNSRVAIVSTENSNLVKRLDEHKQEVEELQKRLTTEFQNIANKIMEEKSQKFTEQNKVNLDAILSPLRDRIKDFEKKVDDTHKEALEKHGGLIEQIVGLKNLNLQMSQDALNLTKALKGENKTQGNWGEARLEMLLDRSGLTKGQEYLVQESFTTEEGKRYQPDVIIKLPEEKHIVIDAKMSLVDYEKYCSSEDDTERAMHLRNHIASVKKHVKGLGEKEYHKLYQVGSLDFVLMFIPVEPAFSLAFQHDQELYNDALSMNVVIVSTSTLLAILRTISSIWKQEYRNKNAVEIARQSGELYDKFKAFVDDLIEVGKKMDQSKEAYAGAMNKLVDGRGNLITRAEKIKTLGAKASKAIAPALIDRASHDEVKEETSRILDLE